jgi:hypothetical protein
VSKPVYIGPWMGYKTLEFKADGEERVASPYRNSYQWFPQRGPVEADCRMSDSRRGFSHAVPRFECGCGFYGYLELDDAVTCRSLFRGYGSINFYFVVLVAGYGDVITHKTGFRSSRMDIVAIHDAPYQYRDKLEKFAEAQSIPLLRRNDLMDFASQYGTVLTEDTLP